LFLEADIVVKVVIIILLAASFWTWAIIVDKVRNIRRLRTMADDFEETFWSGGSLDDLYDRIDHRPPDPMSAIFVSAMREWRRSSSRIGVKTEWGRLVGALHRPLRHGLGHHERLHLHRGGQEHHPGRGRAGWWRRSRR
jgi:biopolymer transport protein ExbB/TolQ